MECTISCCYGNPSYSEKKANVFDLLQGSLSPYEECGCSILDPFLFVKVSRNTGSCISGSVIGTLWEYSNPEGTYHLNYCFNGDIPISYEFLNFADCFTIKIDFTNFIAGPPSENYFQIPSFCDCVPN